MSVRVERVPGEPIVIVKYVDPREPAAQQVRSTSEQIVNVTADISGMIYRINDVREYNLTYKEIALGLAEETTAGLPGLVSDPRVCSITVGSSHYVKLGTQAARQPQYGELEIKLFESMDEALAYARRQARGGK